MVEGSRILPERIDRKPHLTLDIFQFPFVKSWHAGDKGTMSFKGIIDSERKEEEEGNIIKRIKVIELKSKSNMARLT